jgi:alpha-glucosidase (family GH31 glycosyl hydrolase)
MGWHASSYAYNTQAMVEDNVNEYVKAGIPIEGVWLDIPYMDNYRDFTVNATAFPSLKAFTESLHQFDKRMIPIIDAGLSADTKGDKYISAARTANALLHSTETNSEYETTVWPKKTMFLDWFNSASKDIWTEGIQDLYKLFPFDGLWLDMNEATIFCNGRNVTCVDPFAPHNTSKAEAPESKHLRSTVNALANAMHRRNITMSLADQVSEHLEMTNKSIALQFAQMVHEHNTALDFAERVANNHSLGALGAIHKTSSKDVSGELHKIAKDVSAEIHHVKGLNTEAFKNA